MPDPAPITITVATVQGWPDIAANVRTVEVAAGAVDGDVLIADGSGRPAPPPDALGPRTRWISDPGASVFQLRLRSYREARSPIIGVTEDHCRLPADWAVRSLAAHREHPEALAVGGSVVNGATGTMMDRASFLVVQGPFIAPIRSGPTERISGAVCVSYRAEALRSMDGFDGLGAMDVLHQRSLVGGSHPFIADDSIRVVHDQSLGFFGTVLIHFHAGRTISGFRRRHLDARQIIRFLATPLIPFARFARVMVLTRPKGLTREVVRAAPAMWLLLMSQTVGQVTGYLAGPGDSPRKVQ